MKMARVLIQHFKDDATGEKLADFVHNCAVEEARLKYGVDFDAHEYVKEITSKDYFEQRMKTFKGRNNSLMMYEYGSPLLGHSKSDISDGGHHHNKAGLINTVSESTNSQKKSPLIAVRPLDSGLYSQIKEEDESRQTSSIRTDSDAESLTSTERARKRELKESNVFLLNVMQGRFPEDMRNSKITSTDRENLSTLIPQFVNKDSNVTQEPVITYQDVFEEAQRQNFRATESVRVPNLSTLVPNQPGTNRQTETDNNTTFTGNSFMVPAPQSQSKIENQPAYKDVE